MSRRSDFQPPWYLKQRHLQTILPNIIPPVLPSYQQERLELDDGDFIDLLWGPFRSNRTLLVLHGLEGSIQSAYARRIFNYFNALKVALVFMHFRGCSGEANRLLRSYHSGETRDLQRVIKHLQTCGVSEIALLGYSLGGNQVLKYMGEAQPDPGIIGAVAVSVPFRLDLCAQALNRGFARIYQHVLLKSLVKKILKKKNLLDQSHISFPDPLQIHSIRDFDEHFTAPIHGFDSAQDYYMRNSSANFLPGISKPVAIIHARDDPFMSADVIPGTGLLSDSINFDLVDHGGHVGFVETRGFKPVSWLEPRIHRHLIDMQFCRTESP